MIRRRIADPNRRRGMAGLRDARRDAQTHGRVAAPPPRRTFELQHSVGNRSRRALARRKLPSAAFVQRANGGGGGAAYVPPHLRRLRTIQAVAAAMAPGAAHPAAAGTGILAFHPPAPGAAWEYTRTVQYSVPVAGLRNAIVRGHVHYTNSTGNVGPGNMWISGVGGHAFATPAWVVANFNAMPSLRERATAVLAFNTQHGTTHTTL